jgi:hypothetical protein
MAWGAPTHSDWVFWGFRQQGRYVVVGSIATTEGDIDLRDEVRATYNRYTRHVDSKTSSRMTLRVGINSYVIYSGDSYQEALQRVMDDLSAKSGRPWYDPSPEGIAALGEGRLELERGRDEEP